MVTNSFRGNITNQTRTKVHYDDISKPTMAHKFFNMGEEYKLNDTFVMIDKLVSRYSQYTKYDLYHSSELNVYAFVSYQSSNSFKYILIDDNSFNALNEALNEFRSTLRNRIFTGFDKAEYKEIKLDDEYLIVDKLVTPFETIGADAEEWICERESNKTIKTFLLNKDVVMDVEDVICVETPYYYKIDNIIINKSVPETVCELLLGAFGYNNISFNTCKNLNRQVTYEELSEIHNSSKDKKLYCDNTYCIVKDDIVDGVRIALYRVEENAFDYIARDTENFVLEFNKNNITQKAIATLINYLYRYYSIDIDNYVSYEDAIKELLDKDIFMEFKI